MNVRIKVPSESVRLRQSRGMVLILALSFMLMLMVLATALVQIGRSSMVTALQSQNRRLDDQGIRTAQVRFARTLEGPLPSPSPFKWAKSSDSLEEKNEPDDPVISPMPLSGKFEVSPEFASWYTLSGEFGQKNSINRPVPGKAGYNPDEVPQTGYQKGKNSGNFSGYSNLWVAPWHTFVVLNNPENRKHMTVFDSAFPYGIFAPSGSVEVGTAASYSNPTILKMIENEYDIQETYSGSPFIIYARDNVKVNSFSHGKAVTSLGTVDVSGGAVPLVRKDVRNFAYAYKKQIRSAFDTVSATGVKKNNFITGKSLTFDALVKGDLSHLFSIQQAFGFPFFTIPTAKDYAVEWQIYFHVPLPPDGSKTPNGNTKKEETNDKHLMGYIKYSLGLVDLKGTSDPVESKAFYDNQQTVSKYASDGLPDLKKDPDTNADEIAQRENIIKMIKDYLYIRTDRNKEQTKHYLISRSNLKVLAKAENNLYSFLDTKWKHGGVSPGDQKGFPPTLEKEKAFIKDGKNKGYNYGQQLDNLLSILWDAIRFKFKQMMSDWVKPERVVHYRGGPPEIQFAKDGFTFDSNWTVPTGRSLRLDGDVTIQGDLWIMDGAALYVDGNLTLSNPTPDSSGTGDDFSNPLAPRGRVFLGRGSTIVVSGDFSCAGTPRMGSVVVDSQFNRIEYVTSAIVAGGNVTIPHGTVPGMSLITIADYIDEETGSKRVVKYLKDVINLAPQVAKIFGPFQHRECCYAAYADSWSFTIIDIFGIEIPVILPIPVGKSNMNVDIFKIVTYAYQIVLNANLGENLVTDSSWWIIGRGSVPMLPKVGGVKGILDAFKILKKIQDFDFSVSDIVKALETKVLKKLTDKFLAEIFLTIINEVISSVTGIGGKIAKYLEGIISDDGMGSLWDQFKIAVSDEIKGLLEEAYDKLKERLEKELDFVFYEVPGVLVYADGSINVGIKKDKYDGPSDCIQAAGLFIANNDVNIYADQAVGCLMSVEGNVTAREFRYYPYFTRASINVPKKLSLLEDLFNPTIPSSDKDPVEVGIPLYHVSAEGWEE